MASFLTTAGTTLALEEMIKKSQKEIIILSPFLKFNKRIRDILSDKSKVQISIVYGKSELQKDEKEWLEKFSNIGLYFHKNLHAKCYIASGHCIITSMNLYEFSQSNNDEMGVLASKKDDAKLYKDTYEEAQRIIRLSDRVSSGSSGGKKESTPKIPTSKLSAKLKLGKVENLNRILIAKGYVDEEASNLTLKGKTAGGESKKFRGDHYFVWPEDFNP